MLSKTSISQLSCNARTVLMSRSAFKKILFETTLISLIIGEAQDEIIAPIGSEIPEGSSVSETEKHFSQTDIRLQISYFSYRAVIPSPSEDVMNS